MLAGQVEVELLERERRAVDNDACSGALGHDNLDRGAQVLELGLGDVGDVELEARPGHNGKLTLAHVDGALVPARRAGHVGGIQGKPVQGALSRRSAVYFPPTPVGVRPPGGRRRTMAPA